MAERDREEVVGSSAVLASAVAGALIGAAGLAWWLLSEAERRRSGVGPQGKHPEDSAQNHSKRIR